MFVITKKKVHIIAIQEAYFESISKQVKEVLGDKIEIQSTTLKDLQSHTIKSGEIVLLSHVMIKGIVMQMVPKDCSYLVAKRDINFANTQELLKLPPGQTILVVNDNQLNTNETIQSLREVISEHHYIPYSPDEPISDLVDYIVTPGEKDLLPSSLPNVIDIGARLLDIGTFGSLLTLLEMEDYYSSMVKRYIRSQVSQSITEEKVVQNKSGGSSKDIRNLAQYTFADIVAESQVMTETLKYAKEVANSDHPVFIQGEGGTGKSMLAQAIHNQCNHAKEPFISINCLSRSGDIIEKVLFGYEEGDSVSVGLLELATNGTICMEEVGELPMPIQTKILTAIKKQHFHRVNGNNPIPLQARMITTSTRDLKELAAKGLFNQELYYFLSRVFIYVPSLSERKEDFFPLMEDIKARLKRTDLTFTDEVMEIFVNAEWSGNIKELYNVISYLSTLNEPTITIQSLPLYMRPSEKLDTLMPSSLNVEEIIKQIEARGFLEESIEILVAFQEGKKHREAFGRLKIKQALAAKKIHLSEQQLRMRIETLRELGLLLVRQGRAGSTISRMGEEFLLYITSKKEKATI